MFSCSPVIVPSQAMSQLDHRRDCHLCVPIYEMLCVTAYSKVLVWSRLRTAVDDTKETVEFLLKQRTHTTSEQLGFDGAKLSKQGAPA